MTAENEEAEIEEGFVDISIEQDGSLLKKILKEGIGDETPANGSDVLVHYEGTLHSNGTKFDSSKDRGVQPLQFQVGSGWDAHAKFQVIRAWDVGVCTMKKKEVCTLRATPKYTYGKAGCPPKFPGGVTLDFEMELMGWQEHEYEPDEMNSNEERSAYAMKHKEAGNEAMKAQDWKKAVEKYSVAINFVEFSGGAVDGDIGDGSKLSADDKKLYVALLSNSALAAQKVGAPSSMVITLCNKALAVDSRNIKVLYRRAQARSELGEWAMAIEDADRIIEIEPANAEAQKLKQVAIVKGQKSKKDQKATYGKMFGGLP